MPEGLPVIPETITVHMGPADSAAENITVSFPEYIKNVASSEIYPTWPETALRANIYAQISFALNRIYTEYYRSRGYNFDITNNTAADQSFVAGRNIFENISQIVDEQFNNYIRREGTVEPLFAQYCNGTTVTCDGLSQWGTVALAEEGYGTIDILRYYFGDDLEIVRNAPVQGITPSLPGQNLRYGSTGNSVLLLQIRLNRISANYPSIPKIAKTDGYFGVDTEDAVKEFQRIFNLTPDGIVGKATWYRVQYIYNAVKRLNELDSEGLTYSEIKRQFPETLQAGDEGIYVREIQYFLSLVAAFEETIPPVTQNGIYDAATVNAVEGFQRTYGIPVTGIMDEETYNKLYDVYRGIVDSVIEGLGPNVGIPYPGTPLTLGVENEDVLILQGYLNTIAESTGIVPSVPENGIFDEQTRDAVVDFQIFANIPPTGYVYALTWNTISEYYNDIVKGRITNEDQFPGYTIE